MKSISSDRCLQGELHEEALNLLQIRSSSRSAAVSLPPFERDGRTVSEITTEMGFSAATVSKMVPRMESSGFVKKSQDGLDMRVFRVYLTEKSREIRVELERTMLEVEEETFSNFSPEERVLLERFLVRLKETLLAREI